MAKDFSNLKNQPKKVDDSKVEDTAKVDEDLGKTSDSEDVSKAEAKEETKEEKKARITEEKAKAKTELIRLDPLNPAWKELP